MEKKEEKTESILKQLVCLVCNHKWWPRNTNPPKRCPNPDCNSQRWNIGPYTKEERSVNAKKYWKKNPKVETEIPLDVEDKEKEVETKGGKVDDN